MADVLVPEGAVHELLGIRRVPRQVRVNIGIVNWNGRRLLDRLDVLAWLDAHARDTNSPLLTQLHRELADITAKGD